MPRGVKKTAQETYSEQLEKIDAQIKTHKDKISQLESRKKELTEQKKKDEIEMLYQKIQASGKSVGEILTILDQK